MLVRLQKYIAQCGVASRRKAEELISKGMISVNGEIVTELGVKIDDEKDIVSYNGKEIKLEEELVYIMLHKPEEYVTTVVDQFERPTVIDLLEGIDARLYPVGRLDYDTSGLLILTNDGDLTYKLTHPKHNVEKIYIARIVGTPTKEEISQFETGLEIEGQMTAPAKIEIIKDDGVRYSTVKISIKEGRNRQVRKMCEAINHNIASLKRVGVGRLFLGPLKKGEYRDLTKAEIKYLKDM